MGKDFSPLTWALTLLGMGFSGEQLACIFAQFSSTGHYAPVPMCISHLGFVTDRLGPGRHRFGVVDVEVVVRRVVMVPLLVRGSRGHGCYRNCGPKGFAVGLPA